MVNLHLHVCLEYSTDNLTKFNCEKWLSILNHSFWRQLLHLLLSITHSLLEYVLDNDLSSFLTLVYKFMMIS